jgi:hypothetical protein
VRRYNNELKTRALDRAISVSDAFLEKGEITINKRPSEHLNRAARLQNQYDALKNLRTYLSKFDSGLALKRASASRSSGEWNDNDFDVLADGAVVGRIFPAGAAPVARRGCGRCFTVTARTHATWAGYVPPPCQI